MDDMKAVDSEGNPSSFYSNGESRGALALPPPGKEHIPSTPVSGSCTRLRITPGSSLMLKHRLSSFWGT